MDTYVVRCTLTNGEVEDAWMDSVWEAEDTAKARVHYLNEDPMYYAWMEYPT